MEVGTLRQIVADQELTLAKHEGTISELREQLSLQRSNTTVISEVKEYLQQQQHEVKKLFETKFLEQTPNSYAVAAAKNISLKQTPKRQFRDHILLLKPKDSERTPEDIRPQLSSTLNPQKLDIHINNIRTTKSNELLIGVEKKADLEHLHRSIVENSQLQASVTVRTSKPKSTKLIVFNVPSSVVTEDIKSAFLKITSNKNLDISCSPVHRSENTNNWIVEISSDSSDCFTSSRVFIGFNSCSFRPYISLPRCVHCQGLGHNSRSCQNPPCCSICAKQHSYRECT
ncbi:uncharacterized protein LOC118189648 [Stegodyphus dumicola]|uniref:uncharacterized protein LOC118189648 n=1 Tax=Stegodyphus dumicola TaxID=202533 RepID=UPI0015AB6B83|nr:uncharacterized protein LOC118189648 [Stegodyphus dumicola]